MARALLGWERPTPSWAADGRDLINGGAGDDTLTGDISNTNFRDIAGTVLKAFLE